VSDDRWQRIKALFQEVVERPAEERDAFLTSATDGDQELRREVESLLASDADDRGFLDGLPVASQTVIANSAADTAQVHHTLSPHETVGPYEVVALVGAGAMGEVYRARDTKLNREVALKVLPRMFALDSDRLARFKREAQVLAALNHPNIAAIYGLEDTHHVQALVLELVDGPTLEDRIIERRLALDDVLPVARQIAEALEAAHDKGIIHRDLKPANIKVANDGKVKVLDFGLAKVWEGATPAQLSGSPTVMATQADERVILGTPAYMSPEQARGRGLDKRTDIWSFGCVLFEMLSGRSAFAAETISDTITQVLSVEPDWQALPPTTPVRLRDLLRRCLQKDVSRRLRDIGDARLELDEMAAGQVAAPAAPAGLANPELTRRVRPREVLAVAALVVLSVVATAFLTGRNRGGMATTFRQLTFRHGTITGARLAADGQTVVYAATWSGAAPELYIVRPESTESGSIGIANAGIYSVSSHGELAVALGCRLNWGECLGTLAQVPITGGSPREMVKDVLLADWGPDGQRIAVVSFSGGKFQLEYPIGKVLYQSPGWITYARVSPAGDRIAFLDHPELGDTGGSVSVIDLGGKKIPLSSGWKTLRGLAWSGDGNEVWFTGSRNGIVGSSVLHAVTLSGRERTVFSSPGTLKLNDISRDGQRVLLTRGTTRGGIIGVDAGKERDLSWYDYSTVADLSPDGKTLLFYEWGEAVGASATVFIRKTDSADAVRLGEGKPLALSPDGHWALALQEKTPQQLVLLPTGTGEARTLPRGPIVEYLDWAAWAADGRRIVFAGREAGDVLRTYVQYVDGGDPRPVTPDGFVGLLLSPDSQRIVAVDRYGEYYVCSIDEQGEPTPLAGYRDGDVPLQWSADGRFLFVREAGNLVLRIHKLALASGSREFWKELSAPDPAVLTDIGSDPGQVRIAPDGKSYAYTYWTFEGALYMAEGLR
jgi:tRNA A-37 threonylcarbamoyl transferase component Bud32/Tol biopolymer transport system component